ncbi:MAG: AbrB/MazE/SpoVT family DNA-binding domain-containing protein [Sulfolobus sp.]|nr:AbrB/MazE/SpoVT family DNA-binding domain-containing protein [Sulfolobus sp.]
MKPRVYKTGKPGQYTYYLLIPKDVVKALEIKPDDDFILNVEQKDGELVLTYRRVKKSNTQTQVSLL